MLKLQDDKKCTNDDKKSAYDEKHNNIQLV